MKHTHHVAEYFMKKIRAKSVKIPPRHLHLNNSMRQITAVMNAGVCVDIVIICVDTVKQKQKKSYYSMMVSVCWSELKRDVVFLEMVFARVTL